MEKIYQKPNIKVIKVKAQHLLDGTGASGDGSGGGGITSPAREAVFEDFE
jgi:hypothetical protein